MRRESLTLRVNLSGDDVLMLANALEMYPDAVHLHVYQYDLSRSMYRNSIVGTVYDGNSNSERDYDDVECNPENLSWEAIVKIDRYETGIHLEQAPDEWTELICDYSYSTPALMHARNHVPDFANYKQFTCDTCGKLTGVFHSNYAYGKLCNTCHDLMLHAGTLTAGAVE